jgi:hypothetical protein
VEPDKKSLGDYVLLDKEELPSKVTAELTYERMKKDIDVLGRYYDAATDPTIIALKEFLSFLELLTGRLTR